MQSLEGDTASRRLQKIKLFLATDALVMQSIESCRAEFNCCERVVDVIKVLCLEVSNVKRR